MDIQTRRLDQKPADILGVSLIKNSAFPKYHPELGF